MTITVNGMTERLNIGCRTFVSITELLSILDVVVGSRPAVQLNEAVIDPADYVANAVKSGDCIKFESKSIR